MRRRRGWTRRGCGSSIRSTAPANMARGATTGRCMSGWRSTACRRWARSRCRAWGWCCGRICLVAPSVVPTRPAYRRQPVAAGAARPSRSPQALGAELVPMGSAGAKAMAVVRGEAEIYLHSGGQHEWDNCAPAAVAMAHGLHVEPDRWVAAALQLRGPASAGSADLPRRIGRAGAGAGGGAVGLAARDWRRQDRGMDRFDSALAIATGRRRLLGLGALGAAGLAAGRALAPRTSTCGYRAGTGSGRWPTAFRARAAMILQRARPVLLETPLERAGARRDHAQRPVLRALALGGHSDRGRCRDLPAQHLRACAAADRGAAGRAAADAAHRAGGDQPMLGQFARVLQPAGAGRAMGAWRDGQCALGRGQPEASARPGRA